MLWEKGNQFCSLFFLYVHTVSRMYIRDWLINAVVYYIITAVPIYKIYRTDEVFASEILVIYTVVCSGHESIPWFIHYVLKSCYELATHQEKIHYNDSANNGLHYEFEHNLG